MNRSLLFGVITGLCLMVQGVRAQQSNSAHVPAISRAQSEANVAKADSAAGNAGVAMSDSISAVDSRPVDIDSLRYRTDSLPSADALIGVSNVKVSHSKGGDLFVAMDLDVSRLKVRNDREYYYIPILTDGGEHELALPAAVLASRTLYYRHVRNQDLPADVQLYDSRGLLSVSYRVTVPFEPWMQKAVLQVGADAYPLDSLLDSESTELHALSLASGLAAAMALSPEQQTNLSKELENLTLTPEMQDLLAQALQTLGKNPAAVQTAPTSEPVPAPESEPESKPESKPEPAPAPGDNKTAVVPVPVPVPIVAGGTSSEAPAASETPAVAEAPAEPAPEPEPAPAPGDNKTAVVPVPVPIVAGGTSSEAPAEPASGLNPELVQAIGMLGLPGEMQVRLVNEVQALPMSPELRTVLITALQTLAKAEAFVPVFVYRTPAAEDNKMRAEKGTANIEFRLNETGIDPSLRGNRAELDKIRHTVEALANDADYTLKTMKVKGYASPEGAYDLNTALAKKRMEAVKAYVRGLINLPSDRIAADYEAEDWGGLKMVLEASTLPHKADILKIMADTRLTPDAREWKIKSMYKDDYAYMRTYMYPSLRHVDYEVEYEVRAYVDVAEIIRLLNTQPQKLSLQEMYRAAQTMEEGGEAYDEVFETAVRLFPADETANLNAANSAMRWRDLKRAERYLAKAGQSAEAVYARGNHAALLGDYEAAANYFKQAADKGLSEATAAMEQLRTLQESLEAQAPAQDGKAVRAKAK